MPLASTQGNSRSGAARSERLPVQRVAGQASALIPRPRAQIAMPAAAAVPARTVPRPASPMSGSRRSAR